MLQPQIVTTQIGSALWLVHLEGEHDVSNAPDLQREIALVLDTGSSVIVDLAAATFIDSSILAELIRSGLRAQSSPGEQLAVVAPPGSAAAKLFDLVDASNICFDVFDSVDAATASCCGPAARPA